MVCFNFRIEFEGHEGESSRRSLAVGNTEVEVVEV
jgi:hypothetical protein